MNNATYQVLGVTMDTTQLRQKIIDTIGNKKMTVREIEEALGLKNKFLSNIIVSMSTYNLILMDKERSKRFSTYYNYPTSMLQNIFHPLPCRYKDLKGVVYKERHAKHNSHVRVPYETFKFSSIYSSVE